MRSLIVLIVILAAGFVLTAMFIAPNQPELRSWYQTNACPHLDKISPKICEPIRKGGSPAEPT
ncbi:hypothetical protein [Methylobacterium organophilum]|uniref:Uncharacterized protein n=1 Tax=Methylobacterium organophilum TaxID=410 RepID=A0ABQ4T9H5_METOR|nr:hypothetical protein [Methylobacterium organophilum]GJE28321.1 hypothetical protein LKMONMHP_3191 [Methylobacterium organophilum]